MGRRTLLLITSILVAAVGTALIGLYVKGADSRAVGKQLQQTVLVANDNILAGALVKASLFHTEQRAVTSLPEAPLADLSTVLGKSVTTQIFKNQVIQEAMFAAGNKASTTGISPTNVGITVDISDPARAAGLLKLGSKIDIFSIPSDGKAGQKVSRKVLTNVTVIQIGNERDGTNTPIPGATASADDVPRTIVGLDVSVNDARAVKDAEANGALYFAVLGSQAAG
jgi:pilus assembly protein CpaB